MTIKDLRASPVVKLVRLPVGVTEDEIKEWLQGSGVAAETVRLCSHGRSAFAELKSVDDASKVLEIRKPLRVQRPSVYRSSKTEMEQSLSPPDNCVHLSELPFNVTRADVLDFFAPLSLGENGIFLCLDRKGRQQGEGYVEFIDTEAAKKSLGRDGQILLDKPITVQRTNLKLMKLAQEKSFQHLFYRNVGKGDEVIEEKFSKDGAMIKLTGLPVNVTEDQVKQWFKEDDVVVQKIFLPDRQKKGAQKTARAFVHLETMEDLKNALQKDRKFMETSIMMYNVPAWKVTDMLQTLTLDDVIVHVKKLPSVYKPQDVQELFKGSHIAPNGIFLYSMPMRKNVLGAYVQFSDVSSAVRALRKNNVTIDDKKIIVEKSCLKKRQMGENVAAKGKFKDFIKIKDKVVPAKKKQNKRTNKKLQRNKETSLSEQRDTKDLLEGEHIPSKSDTPLKDSRLRHTPAKIRVETPAESKRDTPVKGSRLRNTPAKIRVETPVESLQSNGSLKRKSILRSENLEQPKSILRSASKKSVVPELSPKKKRRSSIRFAATPKRST